MDKPMVPLDNTHVAPRKIRTATWIFLSLVGYHIFCRLPLCRDAWVGGTTNIARYLQSVKLGALASPYGKFPHPHDPFSFLPCTAGLSLPPLSDVDPKKTWASLFDPDPEHWTWGGMKTTQDYISGDPYAGRGIYMCGYLDLPLDYLNTSDLRIVRLSVAKFQVSGLARRDSLSAGHSTLGGKKSDRTIVTNPGGPGASGVRWVLEEAETITDRFSDGQFDVLGWDPRGVNGSLPSASCFPYNADRDRWTLLRGQYRETSAPKIQLEVADSINNATLYACRQRLGDFGRFVSTASVVRDLDEIRKNLDEDELTAYMTSYGSGIGQTYANMFPSRVGRVILDGLENVKDSRQATTWGSTSLDNVTDAWRDGFLGECVKAGPKRCALARPVQAIEQLEARMSSLLESIRLRPASGYTVSSGPSLVTYQRLVSLIYFSLYDPRTWPATARILSELEAGNSTLAVDDLDHRWGYDPSKLTHPETASTTELLYLVLCADSYDAPTPEGGLDWWDTFWANMTDRSWIAGNARFYWVFPCRHYVTYWSSPSEVYRGDLNHSLANPVLLIASTYDPATPLRNGRRLLKDMGENARLIVHHGYGHASQNDPSSCTNSIGKAYLIDGTLPSGPEIHCFADGKPYDTDTAI